ncbi:hypothetical protein D3C78_1744960 [compost metagenome]
MGDIKGMIGLQPDIRGVNLSRRLDAIGDQPGIPALQTLSELDPVFIVQVDDVCFRGHVE